MIGGNPVVAFPDQDKMTRAIDGLELLVSIDVNAESATAKRSDYILAPTMCLEREDISNLSEWWYEIPYARYTEAMIAAPGDLIEEWEMLWGLAHRIGSGIPPAGGPCPMDEKPDKQTFLDLMTAGCVVAPGRVRADTIDGKAVIYPDLHPIVEAGDPDAPGRFDLTAGAMPDQLIAYATGDQPSADFPFRMVSRRSRHRFNSTGQNLSLIHI